MKTLIKILCLIVFTSCSTFKTQYQFNSSVKLLSNYKENSLAFLQYESHEYQLDNYGNDEWTIKNLPIGGTLRITTSGESKSEANLRYWDTKVFTMNDKEIEISNQIKVTEVTKNLIGKELAKLIVPSNGYDNYKYKKYESYNQTYLININEIIDKPFKVIVKKNFIKKNIFGKEITNNTKSTFIIYPNEKK